jgi:transposase
MSTTFKVPKNTVASIILKWKKFGTTKTLPRAGRTAKLSNQGRRALVRVVTKTLMVTLTELCRDGRTFQKDNHVCSTSPIRPL